MNNKPLFFRDEGDMGDILSKAKELSDNIEKVNDDIEQQSKYLDNLKDDLEESVNKEMINERIGSKVLNPGKTIKSFIKNWHENQSKLDDKKDELKSQHEKLLAEKVKIEQNQYDATDDESYELTSEIDKLNQLSIKIEENIEKIDSTKSTIDNILDDNGGEIKDNLLSFDDIEFLYSNYFNLVKSNIFSGNIHNPILNEQYSKQDLVLKDSDHRFTIHVRRGLFKNKNQFNMDVMFLIPDNEKGFYYKKTGLENIGLVTDFINSNDFKSFSVLGLVSPTGWNDEIKNRVKSVSSNNQSILLVDLLEREIITNNNEASKYLIELFSPISLEDEVKTVLEILNTEIDEGIGQFRADKFAKKHQMSRKIVVNAFKSMEKSGCGGIVSTDEGAKDLIFLVR